MADMCPHCGEIVTVTDHLTAYHDWPKLTRQICPGSKQIPRCAESDARSLWNGKPNLLFAGRTLYHTCSEGDGSCLVCDELSYE